MELGALDEAVAIRRFDEEFGGADDDLRPADGSDWEFVDAHRWWPEP